MKRDVENMICLGLAGLLCICLFSQQPVYAGNISETYKYAWSENAGWQNWASTNAQATVETTYLTGYVWAENTGWIKLGVDAGGPYANTDATNWGVNRDTGTGALSGYAWSENAGWVNFNPTYGGITISTDTNKFDGYAWGERVGWIHFQNASPEYYVMHYSVPAVSAGSATSVTSSSATLSGTVNPNGASTTVVFEYGTTTGYGNTVTASESPLSGISGQSASKVLVGLAPNTTYHFRVKATNSMGTTYGSDVSFVTSADAPSASTSEATSVTSGSATLNGAVNPNGTSTAVVFEYGTTTGYGSTATAGQSPLSGSGSQAVSKGIAGLAPGTTYHCRVKATNSKGTAYGSDVSFTTSPTAPTGATGSAAPVGSSTATLNGTVNPNGASTTVLFEYGATTNYGSTVTADQSPATGTSSQSVSKEISGLSPATTYHFRVKATNSAGTASGSDGSFTTAASGPHNRYQRGQSRVRRLCNPERHGQPERGLNNRDLRIWHHHWLRQLSDCRPGHNDRNILSVGKCGDQRAQCQYHILFPNQGCKQRGDLIWERPVVYNRFSGSGSCDRFSRIREYGRCHVQRYGQPERIGDNPLFSVRKNRKLWLIDNACECGIGIDSNIR